MLSFYLAYRYRSFCRLCLVYCLSWSMMLAPVLQARAQVVAVAVPIAVFLGRVFLLAAARMGAQLTVTNVATGAGIGTVAYWIDRTWPQIVEFTENSAASFNFGVTGNIPSFAGLAASVGITGVDTETTKYSWATAGSNVTASVGNIPMKDAIPGAQGFTGFPSDLRWDGYPSFKPISGNSFSTVYDAYGTKSYLCALYAPTINAVDQACKTLPEMPFAEFQYGSQYLSIGVGCVKPQDCAKAYVAGRLVDVSNTINTGAGTSPEGKAYYQYALSDVSASFGSCYDPRYSQYTSFSGYRCPVALSYNLANIVSGAPQDMHAVTENLVIDVVLQKPPFFQAQTLNDYIERYPLAGIQPVSTDSIAAIGNSMFFKATQIPGYEGINYFPITAADAASALQPGEYVPLSSLTTPIGAAAPGTTPGTGNPSAPGGSVTVDLGPNPAIASPTLESAPTAGQILSPIFDLFPSLRNFQVPGHTSQCPALVIPLWGQDVTTTAHCDLIEQQRSAIGAAALVGWSIAAILIVLGA